MKINIYNFYRILIVFGAFSNLEAASASSGAYSFSKLLDESYLENPSNKNLRERVELLESCGVLIKDEIKKRYEFLLSSPLKEVDASVGMGFDRSLMEKSEDFHIRGHLWPEDELKTFFLGGFVQSILWGYSSASQAIDRLPFFPPDRPLTLKVGPQNRIRFFRDEKKVFEPFNAGWKKWWTEFYLPNYTYDNRSGAAEVLVNLLNSGEPESRRGDVPPQWRDFLINLRRQIAEDPDFSRWGASYLRSKILEEKLHTHGGDFPIQLKKDFINKVTMVIELLVSCVNNFVRFAMYHKFLGLSEEGITEDTFVNMNRRSLRDTFQSLEILHENVKTNLGLGS